MRVAKICLRATTICSRLPTSCDLVLVLRMRRGVPAAIPRHVYCNQSLLLRR